MNRSETNLDGRRGGVASAATGAADSRGESSAASRTRARESRQAAVARKKRRNKRRFRWLAFLLFAAAIAAAWWWYFRPPPATVDLASITARVQRRDFSSSVLATGAVKPQVGAEVRVGARISGKVARLRANIGDRVTKGQTIAELEKADLEAIVAQREAELELAEAKRGAVEKLLPKEVDKARLELARWHATQTLYEQQLDRERSLLQADATSQEAFQEAQERLTVAQAQVATAEKTLELAVARYEEDQRQAAAELARAQSALANACVQLSYATITAPIDGVIASVSTQEGETVAAGFNAPTFVTIIDLDRLQVDAFVDEVDIGRVRPGQDVLFTVDTFPEREFRGRVSAIYPKAVIQDNVVNYDVVVEILDRHQGELRPEMTASVTVLLEAKRGVLAVPAKAVKREGGKNVVYVSQDGRPAPRPVTVGWKDGPWIEVLKGLDEGQTVFVELPPSEEPAT